MYVAVKGGEKAIKSAHALLSEARRGPLDIPEISQGQIRHQLGLAVERVMAEGSLYAPKLAALAVKQARGDLVEAIFLLRATRGTFPTWGYSEPLDSSAARAKRRISGTWKDLPGGQILGATFDYSHRLLDFELGDVARHSRPLGEAEEARGEGPRVPGEREPGQAREREPGETGAQEPGETGPSLEALPRAARILLGEGLLETESDDGETPGDLTRRTYPFPYSRELRLQSLARADEGFLLSLAYSTQRGFGSTHPFVAELRIGTVKVEFWAPELGFPVTVAEMEITECETVNQFRGNGGRPRFTRGYGLVMGDNERKALALAMVERALRAPEYEEGVKGPAQDEEFVLSHGDNVEAYGFVSHVKLPHYVDFQAELSLLRSLRENPGGTGDGFGEEGDGDGAL
ncbi:MAG: carbon-phosphorus lyase complex subunit PhnI [Deltaproteobacteria bacterium]|jgi:alpha-D-ribose 1-methylphosphonate 5-triphosphate synthase subunit PhnI|nr:carbon-phosphorus lyase complex subunit PhnI [Deltaproteobacteria bacterium]